MRLEVTAVLVHVSIPSDTQLGLVGGWRGGANRVCVRSRNAGWGQAGGGVRVGLH